ncbi:ribonuclease P protein subunit p30 isoform X1 [Syngnathus scovelli]|uniref:ribonuclease P protein subunit p30 isoform X1 n=1 Tax=Syngnathus scovelli TaxID=161590 RepID=UPI00210F483A|nr:ribonuclease P protein subunit p30 isoform X1 [Syngnathus scovelli]
MPRPSPHNNFISHKAFRRFGPHAAPSIVVSIMSVFMDLNLTFSAEKGTMQQLIDTAAHLGFSTVAVNYMFEPTGKKKEAIPSPKPIEELIDQLPIVQGRSRPIRVLNRLTLVMSELSHWRPNPTEYADFDLLAVQPTTEKLFHAACTQLEVDVISVVVTEKLPFFFKRAPVNVAVERGVAFEVSYAAAIRDATMRRYTIANAVNLAQACRGKNVLVTSAATKVRSAPVVFRTITCVLTCRCVFSLWSCGDLMTSSTCAHCWVCLTMMPSARFPAFVARFCCTRKPERQRVASFLPKRAVATLPGTAAKTTRTKGVLPPLRDSKVS